jgi:hypothetical protein
MQRVNLLGILRLLSQHPAVIANAANNVPTRYGTSAASKFCKLREPTKTPTTSSNVANVAIPSARRFKVLNTARW